MRTILPNEKVDGKALQAISSFHADVVAEVKDAVANNPVVIVGMSGNPFVGKARKLLDSRGIKYKYIEHGGYLSKWKVRLAIKLWSGWPTFPQVFFDGRLIGGYNDLVVHLKA